MFKNIFKIVLLVLFLQIFSGCLSTSNMMFDNKENKRAFSTQEFNGLYSNVDTSHKSLHLWNLLARNYKKKAELIKTDSLMKVKLNLVNDEILSIQLISKDSILSEMTLKGKIENSFFSIRRKYFLLPLPLLLLHFETKNLLAISENGNLFLIHGYKRDGWILIMAGGSGGVSTWHFNKLQ